MHCGTPEIIPTTKAATYTGSTRLYAKSKGIQLELDYQQFSKRRKISCESGTVKKDGTDIETKNENSLALHDNSSALESTVGDAVLFRETCGQGRNIKLEAKQEAFEKHPLSNKEPILSQSADEVDTDAKAIKINRFMQNSESLVLPSRGINDSGSS